MAYYIPNMSQGRSTPCIGDKLIQPLIGNPTYNGYINPYYWVDDHPLLYGNNVSLDPSTYNWVKCSSGSTVSSPILTISRKCNKMQDFGQINDVCMPRIWRKNSTHLFSNKNCFF